MVGQWLPPTLLNTKYININIIYVKHALFYEYVINVFLIIVKYNIITIN